MKRRAIFFTVVTFAAGLVLFQNCSGFEATQGVQGSNLSSSLDLVTGLDCRAVTTVVRCEPGTTLPQTYMANGCLMLSCDYGNGGDNPGGYNPGGDNPGGDNPGGDNPGGDNPGGDNPGGDNPGGDNPGGDNPGDNSTGTMNVELVPLHNREVPTMVIAGYPKSNVERDDVEGLCEEARDFVSDNVVAFIESVHCTFNGERVANRELPTQSMYMYFPSDSATSNGTTRPAAKARYQESLNRYQSDGTYFLIWGDELVFAFNNNTGQCINQSNLPPYVDGLGSQSRDEFGSLFSLCQDQALCQLQPATEAKINEIYNNWFGGRDADEEGMCHWGPQYENHNDAILLERSILGGTSNQPDIDRFLNDQVLREQAVTFIYENGGTELPLQILKATEQHIVGRYQYWFNRIPRGDGLMWWAGQKAQHGYEGDVFDCHLVNGATELGGRDQNAVNASPTKRAEVRAKCSVTPGKDAPAWLLAN